jgi:hypothetical protein
MAQRGPVLNDDGQMSVATPRQNCLLRENPVTDLTLDRALRSLTIAQLQALAGVASINVTGARLKEDFIRPLARHFSHPAELTELVVGSSLDTLAQAAGLQRFEEPLLGRERDASLRLRLAAALGREPDLPRKDGLPREGDTVLVRGRHWLVRSVDEPSQNASDQTGVWLVNLDDDDAGHQLRIYWEMELGARVLLPDSHSLGRPTRLDPPDIFAAWARALRWNVVTATRNDVFTSPFRAGVDLRDYQMVPLVRALDLPRANLFIADDVGLGKTIEAGLIIQELIRRGRVDTVLVVAPASVTTQWQSEMKDRFGLQFQRYTRQEITTIRTTHGVTRNPWSVWPFMIVSYHTLQRPEHRESLLAFLGGEGHRASRSLLVVDEAHTVAPASAGSYGVDSEFTRMIRTLAPIYENRIFLSATPHNGHSNSFSALLEIVEPTRFIRTRPVSGPGDLQAVLVRRLKSDLRKLGRSGFPERIIQSHTLRLADTSPQPHALKEPSVRSWDYGVQTDDGAIEHIATVRAHDADIVLLSLLDEYSAFLNDSQTARNASLVLQKRLLSSIAAFATTLAVHYKRVKGSYDTAAQQLRLNNIDPDDAPDAFADASDEAAVAKEVPTAADAVRLLERMTTLTDKWAARPDARLAALAAWMQQHLCRAVVGPGNDDAAESGPWTVRRLIVFTEYTTTQKWLVEQLKRLIPDERDDEHHRWRIAHIDGSFDSDRRADIIRRFNTDPASDPLRILVATDAVREGINLQAHCADLIHFDIPWNPSKLDQRNGRIDRYLQSKPEVRCGYFHIVDRPHDRILHTVVRKIETIKRELGSAGDVVLADIESALKGGVQPSRHTELLESMQQASTSRRVSTVTTELGATAVAELKADLDRAQKALDESRRFADFDPDSLRRVVEIGLSMAAGAPVRLVKVANPAAPPAGTPQSEDELRRAQTWALPADLNLPGWSHSLDTLRLPIEPGEREHEWYRRCKLRPVVFHPPQRITSAVVHLHLEHPLVQRIMSRFVVQGHAAHDLSRVAALVTSEVSRVHAVLVGRLTLFSTGGARLHDVLIPLCARVEDPFGVVPTLLAGSDEDKVTRAWMAALADPSSRTPPRLLANALLDGSAAAVAAMWPALQREGTTQADRARDLLERRANTESDELLRLIKRQRTLIERDIALSEQGTLALDAHADLTNPAILKQIASDRLYLTSRADALDLEEQSGPAALQQLYTVAHQRLIPMSLTWLVPGEW